MAIPTIDPQNLIPPQDQQSQQGLSPFTLSTPREGNPLSAGYTGYIGYGQSPLAFSYGPYGYGSYGFDPGKAAAGFSNPQPAPSYDTTRGEIWQPR